MSRSDIRQLVLVPTALAAMGGLAWAGSLGGRAVGGVPVFALCIALAMLIQWVAFVPSWLVRSEKGYDLVGGLTYLTLTGVALLLSPGPDARALLLAVLVSVWALRLGTFLFVRIRGSGADGRFDAIRGSFVRFLVAWTLQGVWVGFTLGAALAVWTSASSTPLGPAAWIGLGLWLAGFGMEAVADEQKRRFRSRPENRGRFIASGLWAWSRHPNYFGEIVLWTGVATIAAPALDGWQRVTLLSPLFVALLLIRGSGIPLLEERADARWGGEPDYEAYKASTPVLIPRPPGRS